MQQLGWHGAGRYVTGAMRQLFHGRYGFLADGSYAISERSLELCSSLFDMGCYAAAMRRELCGRYFMAAMHLRLTAAM